MRPTGPPIVLLLTCDRDEMTRKTLESFRHFHPRGWTCYYADDASIETHVAPNRLEDLCRLHGFVPLIRHTSRKGCTRTTDEAMRKILKIEGINRLVLYLQNDFEILREIPVDVCRKVLSRSDVGWIRLNPDFHPLHNPELFPSTELISIGWSFFCYNPCPITTTQTFVDLFKGQTSEWHVMNRSLAMNKQTAAFRVPIVRHMGGDIDYSTGHGSGVTPGGIFK